MNKLKLNQLEMLIAVADSGGFGAAAAELGCTQSRISHAITELETTLKTRLLSRSRSGCVPTDAGYRVLTKARQILRLTHNIVDVVEDNAAVIGQVRIACFRSVGTHLLPHALAALAIEYPGIRIDIDDSCEEREDVSRAVMEGRADIGIAQLPVRSELVTHSFVSDSYVLVVPTSLQLRAPVSWDQLKVLPYIQLNCSGALAILEQCRAAGFTAELSRTLTTDTSIAAMVRHGVGYSILPRLAVYPEPSGVNIVDLPIPAQRQFALIALPDTARTKAVQIVTRFIRNKRITAKSDAVRAGLVSW
ncbi:LysR family transcriptional regulator [Solimicrobium silvestre]|uniref:Transcriptional regulator n=1 Tax=Solimicrobium silvestre TaxID=2099400 RepID=A0A2S9H3Y4_9BURK|nr:LysR family transcriptional regulator [Solimicrobium silvestre]PRC94680.1 Transcriptional regulator [Solimicrobium silvestre]